MEGESGVTRSIIDDLHPCSIQGDQMKGKTGVTRSIIDEIDSWHIQGDQMDAESMVFRKVSPINLILGISKEIKWKVKRCYSRYHE